jgi:hypothetical protein
MPTSSTDNEQELHLVAEKWLWFTMGVSSLSGWSLLFNINWLDAPVLPVGAGVHLGFLML